MPKIYPIWEEYYNRRLDWAYNAKNAFIESIENNNYKKFYNSNSDKSVNIAVYGQSQVGKTTLILKLMGIKEAYFKDVSEILRADIPQGESVTPTSIMYLKSSDDDFYYKEGNDEYKVTEEVLKLKLKDLRYRVEQNIDINNQKEQKSKVLIKIPKKFFEDKNTLNLNIIDLPGYGSANEKEQRHVKKLIEDIIPILNLVLIVSNNIPDLQKKKSPIKQFRYILTRSVSSKSVFKEFKKSNITDKNNYLEFIKNQFEKLSNEVKVYPLEYGDSWSSLDMTVKNKAEGIIDELFEDLRKDISVSSTEYNQLMQNANHYKNIQKNIEEDLENRDNEIITKEKKIEELNQYKIELEVNNKRCEKLIRVLKQSKYPDAHYDFSYTVPKYSGERTVKGLESFLLVFIKKIKQKADNDWESFKNDYPKIRWKPNLLIHEISSNQSSTIRSKLSNYVNEIYYTILPWSKFEKDKKECENVCEEIYKQIKNAIETSFKEEVKNCSDKIHNEISENEIKVKNNSYKIPENQVSIEKLENELKELKIEREEFRQNSSRDLDKVKEFKKFITDGYSEERNKIIKKMNSFETKKKDVFFDLLYLSLITSEFEKLIKQPV